MISTSVISQQVDTIFKVNLRQQECESSWFDEESMITPNIIPENSIILPHTPTLTSINPDSLNPVNDSSSSNRSSRTEDDITNASSITLARPHPNPHQDPAILPAQVPAFLDSSFFITLQEDDNAHVAAKLNIPHWQKLYFTFHYSQQLQYLVNLNTFVATVEFKKNLNRAKRMEIMTILLMLMAIGTSFLVSYWLLPPTTSLVLEVSLVSMTLVSLFVITYRSWKYSHRCGYLNEIIREQMERENLCVQNPTTLTLPTYQSVYEPPPNYEPNRANQPSTQGQESTPTNNYPAIQ